MFLFTVLVIHTIGLKKKLKIQTNWHKLALICKTKEAEWEAEEFGQFYLKGRFLKLNIRREIVRQCFFLLKVNIFRETL